MKQTRSLSFDPKAFLARIGAGKTLTRYHKKETIFRQGDRNDSVFYIQKGRVKLTVVSKEGKEAVVAMMEERDFLGESCLLAGQPIRLVTATSLTESLIVKIEKGSMIQVIEKEPEFAALLLSYVLSRNVRVEEDLVDQLFNASEKRLARVLLLMAHFGKDGQHQTVIPKVSQQTLAEMIGVTRTRVSSLMNKFRRLGFIDYNGTFQVHNSLLNIILHDKSPRDPAVHGRKLLKHRSQKKAKSDNFLTASK
ncbi:MAG: Crp/Fnr family transcriptional regulator [Terriglobia bacterium]